MKKEEARESYIEIVRNSWTFGKMTEVEKARCLKIFDHEAVGTFGNRVREYTERYNAFLLGLGYDGPLWRDPYV